MVKRFAELIFEILIAVAIVGALVVFCNQSTAGIATSWKVGGARFQYGTRIRNANILVP